MSNYNGLLEFIYKAENAGKVDYDVIYSGIRPEHYPPKPVTQMTVGEVLDWQDRQRGHRGFASHGGYAARPCEKRRGKP